MMRLRETMRRRRAHDAIPAEGLLYLLGAESTIAEDILGDMAEEYALRRASDGAVSARWWYLREALRSAPHLVAGAIRQGEPEARIRLLVWAVSSVLAATALVALVLLRDGPPARLVPDVDEPGAPIVLSITSPVWIPMRVLDARGHVLPRADIRFALERGSAATVSDSGRVRCADRGTIVVRATLGTLSTRVPVRCDPVRRVTMRQWYNFALGSPAQELRVTGYGVDGRPVPRMSGFVSISDAQVAELKGSRLRPLAPGRAWVSVSVGSQFAMGAVTVFEPVRTFAGLRDEQRFVLATTRLHPGERQRWPLPRGLFWLVNQVDARGEAPALALEGSVRCAPAPGSGVYRMACIARDAGATLLLSHPGTTTAPVDGTIALERDTVR